MNVGETYSGFQPALKFDIGMVLKENMEHLQMAYSFDKFLCTHAGVSSVFMDRWFKNTWNCDNLVEKLNETFTYSPFIFRFIQQTLIQVDSLSQKFSAVMLEESTSVYGVGYVKSQSFSIKVARQSSSL